MTKQPRPSADDERLELKAATRRALSFTKASAFAMVTRVKAPALSQYGSPAEEGDFMPIDVLLDLERDIGIPVITETLAALQGFRLVPIAAGEPQPVGFADIAEISKESGDVVQALAEGMRDGNLDAAERRNAMTQLTELGATVHRLKRKVAGGAA